MNSLGRQLGVRPKVIPTAWVDLETGLLAGRYDVILSGWTPNPETPPEIVASEPYHRLAGPQDHGLEPARRTSSRGTASGAGTPRSCFESTTGGLSAPGYELLAYFRQQGKPTPQQAARAAQQFAFAATAEPAMPTNTTNAASQILLFISGSPAGLRPHKTAGTKTVFGVETEVGSRSAGSKAET